MKYIIFKERRTGAEWPVIFPDNFVHALVSRYMQVCATEEHKFDLTPVRAGSVSFFGGVPSCTGESETLGLKSNPKKDAHIIRTFDYLHGLVS